MRKLYHKLTCTPVSSADVILCHRYARDLLDGGDTGYGQYEVNGGGLSGELGPNDPFGPIQHEVAFGSNLRMTVGQAGVQFQEVTIDIDSTVFPFTWRGHEVHRDACVPHIGSAISIWFKNALGFSDNVSTMRLPFGSEGSIGGRLHDADASSAVFDGIGDITVSIQDGVHAGEVVGSGPASSPYSDSVQGWGMPYTDHLYYHNKTLLATVADADGNIAYATSTAMYLMKAALFSVPTHPNFDPGMEPKVVSLPPPVWEPDLNRGGGTWVADAPTELRGGFVLDSTPLVIEYTVTATDVIAGNDTANFWFQAWRPDVQSRVTVRSQVLAGPNIDDITDTFDGILSPATAASPRHMQEQVFTGLLVSAGDVLRFTITGEHLGLGGAATKSDLPFLTLTNLQFDNF